MENLSILGWEADLLPFEPTFLASKAPNCLTSVKISIAEATIESVAAYVQLPSMSRICVHVLDERKWPGDSFCYFGSPEKKPDTAISFMNLGNCHLSVATVSNLLGIRPVTKLWLGLPRRVDVFTAPYFTRCVQSANKSTGLVPIHYSPIIISPPDTSGRIAAIP